jgi:hypothetical protein
MMSTPPEPIRKRSCLPLMILSVDHDGSSPGRVKSKIFKMVYGASPSRYPDSEPTSFCYYSLLMCAYRRSIIHHFNSFWIWHDQDSNHRDPLKGLWMVSTSSFLFVIEIVIFLTVAIYCYIYHWCCVVYSRSHLCTVVCHFMLHLLVSFCLHGSCFLTLYAW